MEDNFKDTDLEEDVSSLELIDIWHMVWDHKRWYVLCMSVCLLAAAFYVYRSPEIYSRTAKVIIDEGAQEAAMRDLSSFTGSMSRLRYSTNVDNEVEAFASPDLMEVVAERVGLQTTYVEKQILRQRELFDSKPFELFLAGENPQSSFSFTVTKTGDESFALTKFSVGGQDSDEFRKMRVEGVLRDTVDTPVGRLVIAPTLHAADWNRDISVSWHNAKAAGKRFARSMAVSISGKQTSVVVLTINDKFPKRAEDILNSLIDVYNEAWVTNKNRSAKNTTSFINDRLVVIEQELGGIESDLKEYKERNNLTDMKAISNVYLAESSEYAARSFEVNNQLSIANYIKDYLNNPANTLSLIPSNSGLTSNNLETQISSYNELVLRRDNLLANSGENSPLVADLNYSIESIRTAILRSIDNLIATLRIQADQISRQEEQVLARIAASTGQEFQLLSITRQQKVKESLYVYLLQKREENELASLMNVSNTRLIMAPTGESNPVSPRRLIILIVAIFLGFGFPFVVFFLRKTLKNSIDTKTDVTDFLSMPYLADIPFSGGKSGFSLPWKGRGKDADARPIVVKAGRRDIINESFRVLRTNVDMMLHSVQGCRVVMSTSMYPGSGKTFVTMNLAATMAIKGARTLLIDLDMRKASMSLSFAGSGPGVSEYLNESVEDIDRCIVPASENLDVMRVGVLPPNPSELLLGERFSDMMEKLKSRYSYIFIDCPPAEVVADAAIISSFADLTVFVVRAGLMDKRDLPFVEDLYKSGKYGRMAAILNGVDAQSHYGYHGAYSRGYGYGYTYGNNTDEN